MKRSLLRLIVTGVLACWALGFIVLVIFSRNLDWTEERAQHEGVFLVHRMLDGEAGEARAARLAALAPHFDVPMQVLSPEALKARIGRGLEPGERLHFEAVVNEEWYFVAFTDGSGALAAGPVNPSVPPGAIPAGLVVGIVLIPLIAGFVALRIERELSKVERASQALAAGELAARVDNQSGPSSELAASFNAMAERVERLIRSRDELVQAVSHELGSPLSRLRFHLELLDTEGRDPERDERHAAIARELDALDALVAELLSYVQSDELEIARRRFDPVPALGDLGELARLEQDDPARVEVELALPAGVEVFADPRLFQRAVENILRNAVRHARSRVRLEVSDDADQLRVTAHDDGPGIPEEAREDVLAPFFRLEPDRARKTGGAGLGLAIVHRILQRHGGSIAIDRSSLGGARVALCWPRASSEPAL